MPLIEIGKIVNTHGLRGHIKVEPWCDGIETFEYLKRVKHAGSVFLGRYCPEAIGDYFAGTNHTLPTSGTAKFSSPLSVDDFVKKTQYTYYTKDALERVARDVAFFAEKEGLTAHAKSAVIRSQSTN